jgi:hypothetical protein
MAGYSGYSKSNNAVAAESDGRYPASVLAKRLRVSADAVRAVLTTSEWHHSSKYYNRVHYYDGAALIALAENPGATDEAVVEALGIDAEDVEAARRDLERLRAWRKPAADVVVHEDCVVEWIEWTGTRARPKATEMRAEGARVEVKGKTATVTLADGRSFTKRTATNGFYFRKKPAARPAAEGSEAVAFGTETAVTAGGPVSEDAARLSLST